MAYNLFIAYDLDKPGQNYAGVIQRIKELGKWYHFQLSLFYLKTDLTPQEAHARIREVMDANDKLCVINAQSAVVSTYPVPDIQVVNFEWFRV